MVDAIKSEIEKKYPGTIVSVHSSGVDLSCDVPVGSEASLKSCSVTVRDDLSFRENVENALFMVGIVKKAGNA